MATTEWLRIDDISMDAQTRVLLNEKAIEDYSEMVLGGVEMDPVTVFHKGEKFILSKGYHRLHAYKRAGKDQIRAIVRPGTRLDAIREGAIDNLCHRGERLTLADKRNAAKMLLRERPDWADAVVAKYTGLSDKTVGKVRRELEAGSEIPNLASRIGRDGKEYGIWRPGEPQNGPSISMPADQPSLDGEVAQPMPDFSADYEMVAFSESGDLIVVTPSAKYPGYWYLARYEGIDADSGQMEFTRRPVKVTPMFWPVIREYLNVDDRQEWRSVQCAPEEPWYLDDAMLGITPGI